MTDESHTRNVVVWDVPPAVACGDAFVVRLGIKCEAGCPAAGWPLEIRDHTGGTVQTAVAGDQPWRGTEALHGAEIRLQAPEFEGRYGFEAVALPVDVPATAAPDERSGEAPPGHDEVRARFNVRVVGQTDNRLRVVAIDRESQLPIAGARVVVHPFRVVTGEQGVAEIDLPQGPYRLYVSANGFMPLRLDGELTTDETVRAELDVDREPSDAELWS